ncbi:DoxX-like family protein [Patescibacteria group bacterium]|nr:DoxX-like family protein [Patescibacteria group bacterium]
MKFKKASLYVMSVFYIFNGVNHFLSTEFYLVIMPPYIPFHLELVYLSGVIEIFLGILLLAKKLRKPASWGIIFLLIAIFPANIYHLTSAGAGLGTPLWALLVRLPFQPLFIAWAHWHTRD